MIGQKQKGDTTVGCLGQVGAWFAIPPRYIVRNSENRRMRANAGYAGAHPPCALGSLVHMGVRVNTTTYHGIPSRKSIACKSEILFS